MTADASTDNMSAADSDRVKNELLMSRDCLVIRVLLLGYCQFSNQRCAPTLSLLRSLVDVRPEAVVTVIKQGLKDAEMNVLVNLEECVTSINFISTSLNVLFTTNTTKLISRDYESHLTVATAGVQIVGRSR